MSENQAESVLSITLGAVGQPGARVFYLQFVTSSSSLVSLMLEKTQALILAEDIHSLLAELKRKLPDLAEPKVATSLALQLPGAILFRAGQFGLQYNPEADLVAIQISELRGLDQGTPEMIEVWVTRQQLRTLADTAQRVARQGVASTYN